MVGSNAKSDIVIVGGGMVGMTLAAATAGAGIPTTLIEAEPLPAMTEATFDGRSSAIAYGSQQVLAGVGAWQYLAADASPIREIRASDGGWRSSLARTAHESPFFVHYNSRDLPEGAVAAGTQPPFGWIVENRAIRRGLLKRLAETPNLTHIAPARVAEVAFQSGGAALRLQDGREIRARLVIARAALDRLDELEGEPWTNADSIDRARRLFEFRQRRFKIRAGKLDDEDGLEDRSQRFQRMMHDIYAAQREALVRLRDDRTISSDVMRRLEREVDLEESRLDS
jgi:hypothetical protein